MTLLSRLKRLIPSALKPVAKNIYHKLFRLRLRAGLWMADRQPHDAEIPVPPAILRFRVSETLSAEEFLRIGQGCAQLVKKHAESMGIHLTDAYSVLDFGCGCGRTIRWFLTPASKAEFHGGDVDREAVEWCAKNLPRGHFLATPVVPPLPYASNHFDFIYCLSVFTHLDEAMQDLWLAELKRILKPGGVLLLTIYGASGVAALDAEEQQALQYSGFVHKRSQKLKGLLPDWYQTSWHSREYMVRRLSGGFEDIRYCEVPDGVQDVIIARKMQARFQAP